MTTLLSTPTTLTVTSLGTSALATLAASLSSGQWASFNMNGLNLSLVDAGGGHSIIEYCARGHWDPLHKKIQFWGQGHYASEKLITWDDATNQWSIGTPAAFGGIGHAYYHLALDSATGDLYLRKYSSGAVKRKPYGGAWTNIAPFNQSYTNQVAGGLEWLAGGLVFVDVFSCQTWNPTTNAWTTRSSSLSGLGNYHNWIAAAGGYAYFGGGDGSSKMYRVDGAGNITNAPSTPFQAGIWASGGSSPVLSHPDRSQLLLFSSGTSGAIYRFNGSAWQSHGTHQIGGVQWFGVPIPDYGVVLFVSQASSVSSPTVKVYKP